MRASRQVDDNVGSRARVSFGGPEFLIRKRLRASLGWKSKILNESEMALFHECMQ
jgi:hypothetical protein